MIVPPISYRRVVDRDLVHFFREHRRSSFRRAISGFCRFYGVKAPRIEWYEYLDWGKTAGKTFADGRIHLVHPENWKRGRVYKSERMWVQMIYHEMAHYLFWAHPEPKADAFANRMVRGLRQAARKHPRRAAARARRIASPQRRRRRRLAAGLNGRRRLGSGARRRAA